MRSGNESAGSTREDRRPTIPAVDPTKTSRLKALVEPVARSRTGRWWLINISPKLDRAIFRLSGGRFTSIPMPILVLVHTGARTGKKRENLLTYFTDDGDLIVMASNYGRDRNPAWLHNVQARPEVEVRVAGQVIGCRAVVTAGEDRDRLWGLAKLFTRAYADYETRAEHREIQVVRLRPASATEAPDEEGPA